MKVIKHCIVVFYSLITIGLFAQPVGSAIEMNLIAYKSVRTFISDNNIDAPEVYKDIKPSWFSRTDPSSYNLHVKQFIVNEDISKVWQCYEKANPTYAWSGRMVDFGLLISKYNNSFTYETKGDFSKIDTGQVYFLNLKLLKGIYNIPVAFEIINVDPESKIIEFSYISENKSQGKQIIQFIELENGKTEVIHKSYFRSDSKLRDGIYPYYHKKIIKDFHHNMRRLIKYSS
ncbi:MAG: hypothetical protein JXA77_10940 [Bacteroidales bacterium]|nr:hypothetical protein [Bacteroidales bacterium]MBN2819008.1 hypothetical protein [Bacteroidales bacterium]